MIESGRGEGLIGSRRGKGLIGLGRGGHIRDDWGEADCIRKRGGADLACYLRAISLRVFGCTSAYLQSLFHLHPL